MDRVGTPNLPPLVKLHRTNCCPSCGDCGCVQSQGSNQECRLCGHQWFDQQERVA